jgi:mycothiol synthase
VSEIRPFDVADAPAVEALMRRSYRVVHPAGVTLEEHAGGIAEILAHPEEAVVALAGDEVVGYAHPSAVRLEVDPAHRRRGHGRRLLEAARRLVAASGDDQLELWVPREGPGLAFAMAMGMRYRSSFHLLRLSAGTASAPPTPVAGFGVRPLRPGQDEPAYVAMLAGAFADHPSPMHFDLDEIRSVHARPSFNASDVLLAFVAAQPEVLAGMCRATLKSVPDAEGQPRGDVRLVGVLPAYRRRGLGRELLRWGIAHVRDGGARDVDLAVEALNAGALRLYLDEGFVAVEEWPRWVISAAQTR